MTFMREVSIKWWRAEESGKEQVKASLPEKQISK